MRGVAGDEAALAPIALRDQLAPHPRHDAQNLEVEVAPDRRGGCARFDSSRRVVVQVGADDEKRKRSRPLIATMVAKVPSLPMKM